MNQAAIAITQETYLALSDLRLQLEQKEQEWLVTYNSTLKNISQLSITAETYCHLVNYNGVTQTRYLQLLKTFS